MALLGGTPSGARSCKVFGVPLDARAARSDDGGDGKEERKRSGAARQEEAREGPGTQKTLARKPVAHAPRPAWNPEVDGISAYAARNDLPFFEAAHELCPATVEDPDNLGLPPRSGTRAGSPGFRPERIEDRLSGLGVHTSRGRVRRRDPAGRPRRRVRARGMARAPRPGERRSRARIRVPRSLRAVETLAPRGGVAGDAARALAALGERLRAERRRADDRVRAPALEPAPAAAHPLDADHRGRRPLARRR